MKENVTIDKLILSFEPCTTNIKMIIKIRSVDMEGKERKELY
jgi:hypothetical protein